MADYQNVLNGVTTSYIESTHTGGSSEELIPARAGYRIVVYAVSIDFNSTAAEIRSAGTSIWERGFTSGFEHFEYTSCSGVFVTNAGEALNIVAGGNTTSYATLTWRYVKEVSA